MKWLEIEWNEQEVKVPVQKMKGSLWFHIDGETHSIELQAGRKKGAGASAAANGETKAPMPGKILKVYIKEGDEVSLGQALIAMEAMKMEYTLEADMPGKVTELKVKVGDQVALGDLLAKIEESGEKA